ncbi:hypothetical protein [Calothrix sp. NIES-2100]|uniref:hypothetical protein n=1 Tax=Calothrix sp. NIES-2100 TaxID=1954172 RepID=UPI000BBBA2CD
MNTSKISPQVETDHINKRFNEFNCSMCEQLKFRVNEINFALKLLSRGRLDNKMKRIALAHIEENAHMQSLLLDQLLNGYRSSEASSQSLLGLLVEIRFVTNTLSSWSKSLHGNQLDQSTLIAAIEVMGNHARNQSELIDRLRNWILAHN